MNAFTKHMLEHIGACTSLREAKAYAAAALLEAGIGEQKATLVDLVVDGSNCPNKIDGIKALRNEFGLGLKEAKDIIEGPPHTYSTIERNGAEAIQRRLLAAGVRTTIVGYCAMNNAPRGPVSQIAKRQKSVITREICVVLKDTDDHFSLIYMTEDGRIAHEFQEGFTPVVIPDMEYRVVGVMPLKNAIKLLYPQVNA